MDVVQRFGRYKVTGTLGRGAMGQVYAAEDEALGRSVAVKTLLGGATGLGAKILDERFRLEARAVAALNHPSIVQVYDIDLDAKPPYIVMERVAGPSLRERLEQGPLAPNEVRALGIQIGRALAAAHDARIVHRDVKPANILIAGESTWKLADFGVAHVPDSSLTMTGQFVGSPAYSPPEALLRGESTAAGDIFGLGATLYLGATGRWPRGEATTSGLLAPVPSVRELAPTLPDDLISAIDSAVHIEPAMRPTARALVDALSGANALPEQSRQSLPRATPVPAVTHFVPDGSSGSHPGHARPRWHAWAAGAGLFLALVVVGATQSGSDSTASNATRAGFTTVPATARDPIEQPPPGTIRAVPPTMNDRRAAKDWEKIVEELYEQNFTKAEEKLREWEGRWGETAETRNLRKQLDALPSEYRRDD